MTQNTKRFLRQEFIPVIVVAGYGVLLLALASFILWQNWVLGIVLVIIGFYLSFTFEGVQLNYGENRFKIFSSKFGMTKNEWHSFKEYPYVSILSMNQRSTVYGVSGTPLTSKFMTYRVYLLNQSHLQKILLEEFDNEVDAERLAHGVALKAGIKVVTYSPQISAASRARRR